jgi:hypothetical protein
MLKIRPEQIQVFQEEAEISFARRLVEYVRQRHANVVVQLPQGPAIVKQIPNDALHEMVRNGIARAREYGMSWESSLAAFVVLMFVSVPNFDQHPTVRRVLEDKGIAPESRINHLLERVSQQEWEAIKKNYDVKAWNLSS